MQTSTRPRDHAGGYRGRHGPQISISDDNHHVTDAISSLYEYGDQQQGQQQPPQQHPPRPQARHGSRPLSFLPSAHDQIHRARPSPENEEILRPTRPLSRTQSDKLHLHSQPQSAEFMVGRNNSTGHGPGHAPSSPLRSPAETATASFPLNDIDYESSPAAVAQELSNLQAIRRMSMDVNVAGDPDLPSFSPAFGIPTAPPSDATDEDDAARLFWVPASLHPELAPKEFKTFLDSRVESIKRRSGEYTLSPEGPARASSDGGLRRKKSMLSRQIDNSEGRGAEGYQDGAERLDRKKSQTDRNDRRSSGVSNLQELEMLMKDPEKMMQRLSIEGQPQGDNDDAPMNDMPILPAAPGGSTLRRSTRTTYRKGSLRQGERLPPSKRAAKAMESDSDDIVSPRSPTMGSEPPFGGLTRVQTEPTPALNRRNSKQPPPENFSRPGRGGRSRVVPPIKSPPPIEISKVDSAPPPQRSPPPPQESSQKSAAPPVPPVPSVTSFTREPKPFVSQIASNGRTTASIPSINEPSMEEQRPMSQQSSFPDRKSSMEASAARGMRASAPPSTVAPLKRIGGGLSQQHNEVQPQTLQHMAANPSPLPGNSTRTDSLSFIPTLTEDKRAAAPEPKKPQKRSGWSWGSLLGNEEKEKSTRGLEDDEIKEIPRSKPKSKLSGTKAGDTTRLDVLQTTMESSRTNNVPPGRESLVLERGDVKLEEERKKESTRKSGDSRTDGKKEKDSGLFSSLFGGGKKNKSDRDSSTAAARKSGSLRPYSPEPPRPVLKPDVDYNWTRFSILEERAIYRMAHIKLANPRRALYSQVLLSNFMYSYLAKVQQMHPQIQIPQSAAQKAAQAKSQTGSGGSAGVQGQSAKGGKEEGQPEEFSQYQRYQQQLQAQDLAAQQSQGQQSSPSHTPHQQQYPHLSPVTSQQQQQQQQSYQQQSQSPTQLPYYHQQQQSPQSHSNHTNGTSNGSVNYLEDTSSPSPGNGGADGYASYQRPLSHSAYQYQPQAGSSFDDEEEEESDEEYGALGGGSSTGGRGGGAGEMW